MSPQKLDSDRGTMAFAGTAKGNTLAWTMKVSKPMPVTLKYDLTIGGDVLTGSAGAPSNKA